MLNSPRAHGPGILETLLEAPNEIELFVEHLRHVAMLIRRRGCRAEFGELLLEPLPEAGVRSPARCEGRILTWLSILPTVDAGPLAH